MERKRPLPTVEYLRERLRYDPDTGVLYWKPRVEPKFGSKRAVRIWNARYAHKAVGRTRPDGYIETSVDDYPLLAHRIVWALHHGRWPSGHIDHLNGITNDNRPSNLRDGSTSHNMRNRRSPAHNTSGVCGVYWHRTAKLWHARIGVDGIDHSLGYFRDLDAAAKAREAAKVKFGFTERHGTTI